MFIRLLVSDPGLKDVSTPELQGDIPPRGFEEILLLLLAEGTGGVVDDEGDVQPHQEKDVMVLQRPSTLATGAAQPGVEYRKIPKP